MGKPDEQFLMIQFCTMGISKGMQIYFLLPIQYYWTLWKSVGKFYLEKYKTPYEM